MFRPLFSTVLMASALCCGAAGAQTAKAPPPAATPKPLSAAEMDGVSGGAEVSVEVLNRQQLTGATTGNVVSAGTLTTGQVTFAPNALSGFNGIGNFVVNTGANNTLQGAINVSVVTAPPR